MRKVLLATILAAAITGCGNKKCDELKTKLCEGLDEATCKAIKAEFDKKIEDGPNGEKLSDGEKDLGCKMILEDKEAFEAYRKVVRGAQDK